MKKLLLLPFVAFTFHFSSCAPIPDTTDTGQVRVQRPSNSLIQQGLKEFASIKSKKRISYNASYNAQTKRVSERLKSVINMPGARWEFVVFEDPTPNAFALPGGKVGIHTGLFPITKTDAGLAAVLGHEISHVTRNHAGARQQRTLGLALGGVLLDQVLGKGKSKTERAKIAAGYGTLATVGLALPFSRKAELEADRIGTLYMAKAGYNPNEAVAMWQRFAAYKQSNSGRSTPEFLSTHPLDSTRINALKAYIPTAMKEYNRR